MCWKVDIGLKYGFEIEDGKIFLYFKLNKMLSLLEVLGLFRKFNFFLSSATLQPNKTPWDVAYFVKIVGFWNEKQS